jgi:choice-of-anchor B domain-containing protein
MNKLIFSLLFTVSFFGAYAQQPCPDIALSCNMTLFSRWDHDSLPKIGKQSYNSVWGYYDSIKGREYAIIGGIESTFFIDVTDPTNPVLCDSAAGRSKNCIHREYKNYKNYLYAVADEGMATLQIFDMQYLPDSVHKVYDSDTLTLRSHTLFIEGEKLYLNSNMTKHAFYPMTIASLANPEVPAVLGHLIPPIFNGSPLFGHVHDSYVRNDTAFCSNGTSGMFIYDVRNPASPVLLNAHSNYPDKGYNHSSAMTKDGKILVYTDETQNMTVKIYDATNVKDLGLKSTFKSHEGAVAHNPYIIGDFIYLSYYQDGVYIYNIKDPAQPYIAAYYDTYSQAEYTGFEGAWGVYPFLPSGNILVSDMTNGLFVLKPATALGLQKNAVSAALKVSPNPFNGEISVSLNTGFSQDVTMTVFDMMGREILTESAKLEIGSNMLTIENLSGMPAGMYFLKVSGKGINASVKLLKE